MESGPSSRSSESILTPIESAPFYPPEAFEFLEGVEERHFWFIERNRIIGEWLMRHIPDIRHRRVLEVGCGNGTVLSYLHRMGLQVMGVDLFQRALVRCRRRVLAPLYRADATRLPFQERVEVVGLFDCLEHFDHPEHLLGEVRRCLVPGGFLLVTVPAVPSLYGWVDRLSGHRLRYRRADLIDQLRSNGYEIERVSYFMTAVFPAIMASRFLNEWRFRNTPDPHKPFAEQFQVPPGMNALFRRLCALDHLALRFMNLPIGGSLIALGKKT